MDFFEVVEKRRSIRRYTDKKVPKEVMEKAFHAAILAPNSSNLQTCKFYWVKSTEKRKELSIACLNQGAARTAAELVIVVVDRMRWKENARKLVEDHKKKGAKPIVTDYYTKMIPLFYGFNFFFPIKWLVINTTALFRPLMRGPVSARDVDEIGIKSAALAAENFMLAITAQGFSTCPMEGIDEKRVKKILKLKCHERVVMAISVGEMDPKGLWGERVRFEDDFVKVVD